MIRHLKLKGVKLEINIEKIIQRLKLIKSKLEKEGFIIEGIFGSYARNQANKDSDLDILYDVNNKFIERYGGFGSFGRISDIKEELQNEFGVNIDLVVKTELTRTGRKYILKDVVNV
ncbi:MAG: nucleotidyltransferase [Candidatus Cloacimonadota bacterium]|nr:MAG: nucleotidyltransferase [Candidatus Cloacimonadota bacterium]